MGKKQEVFILYLKTIIHPASKTIPQGDRTCGCCVPCL